MVLQGIERDNVRDHRAGTIDLQAEKARASPASRASYCYPAIVGYKLVGPRFIVSLQRAVSQCGERAILVIVLLNNPVCVGLTAEEIPA